MEEVTKNSAGKELETIRELGYAELNHVCGGGGNSSQYHNNTSKNTAILVKSYNNTITQDAYTD